MKDLKQLQGQTVGAALKRAGVDLKDVTFIDEPPGKLRAIRFPYKTEDFSGKVKLEFQYHAKLFDAERQWSHSLIEAQRVTRVILEPDDV